MTRAQRPCLTVLCYSEAQRGRSVVRRYYAAWRTERGLPDRCDNPNCVFSQRPLVWNGKTLPLILDHKSGNRKDNTPDNLRYLCPNCESQQTTRGGANKGRLEKESTDGYTMRNRDGTREHMIYKGDDLLLGSAAQPFYRRAATTGQPGETPNPALKRTRRKRRAP
jgi:hypothetical protein